MSSEFVSRLTPLSARISHRVKSIIFHPLQIQLFCRSIRCSGKRNGPATDPYCRGSTSPPCRPWPILRPSTFPISWSDLTPLFPQNSTAVCLPLWSDFRHHSPTRSGRTAVSFAPFSRWRNWLFSFLVSFLPLSFI